jgi:two-component system, NarL family, nitrate/nitrite sensor histidine kinase NarX
MRTTRKTTSDMNKTVHSMLQRDADGSGSVVADNRQGIEALKILAEAAGTGERDPEALLGRSLEIMMRLAGAAAGIVRVVTSDGAHMRLVAAAGLPAELVEREQLVDLDCGICGATVRDDAVHEAQDLSLCAGRAGSAGLSPYRAITAIPLKHLDKVLGTYTLYFSEPRDLPEDLVLLFQAICEHLGMALEHARVLRENMRMTLMNERQMMANEVHDSLAQTMAYMNIRLTMMLEAVNHDEKQQALKYASDTQQALEGAYAGLRELLSQFRNRMDPLGLVHALQEVVSRFYDRTGISLDFENRVADLDLTVNQEAQVFHIVQEALANVVRHSGAKHARLTVDLRDDQYEFTVEDDGLGFFAMGNRLAEIGEPMHLRHHLGINIMRERAQSMNGRIEIANLPQGGVRMRLVLPAGASGDGS